MSKTDYIVNPNEKWNYINFARKNLTLKEFGLYVYLISYHNQEKGYSYPSRQQIATDLQMSVKNLKPLDALIKSLIKKGFIVVETGSSDGMSNRYYFVHYTKINTTKPAQPIKKELINTPSTISCKDSKTHTKEKYTKEEIEEFKINLSLGADYPELREYLEWLSSNQD